MQHNGERGTAQVGKGRTSVRPYEYLSDIITFAQLSASADKITTRLLP